MKKVLSKIFVIFAFCFSFTETYAQYNYVTQSLNKQLSNLRYVINNTGK